MITKTYDDGTSHTFHISEKDFEDVCRKYEKKGLNYTPADWEWEKYPDVGFSTLYNDEASITMGHNRYSNRGKDSEEIIRVAKKANYLNDEEYIIDTKEQLEDLIKKTFNIF